MTILEKNIIHSIESRKGPRYRTIAQAICESIETGDLLAGEKLPTHRALAEAVGVSIQTISFAYGHAQQEGYVYGKVGSGTYVSHHRSGGGAEFLKDRPLNSTKGVNLSIACAIGGPQQEQAFRKSLLELSQQPHALQLINVVKPFAGLLSHREAAQVWLQRNGIEADVEHICICNGATHGLLIAMSSLLKPGATVACEVLTDHGLIALARTLNFKLEGIAMDHEGMIPEALELCISLKQISAICITPTMHNPTTATMSDERRQKIANIALKYAIPVVEDDVFGPLETARKRPVSSYIPELSYYITSFTKAVASGLRIGYLVPPRAQIAQVIGRLRSSSWMASPMAVEIASQWITGGQLDDLIAWQRRQLIRRQQLAASIFEDLDYCAHPQGPLLWLTLPEAWRTDAFIAEAKTRNISITPAEPFVVGHQPAPHSVRISLASAESEQQLEWGLKSLRELLREVPAPSYRGLDIY